MATPSNQLDEILASTFFKVRPTFVDQITKDTPLLAWLDSNARATEDGGYEIRRPVMYALNGTVKSYSGYDKFDTTPQGGFGYAVYNWRNLAGTVTISGEEQRKNSGKAQIIALVTSKIEQLRLSIEDTLSTMVYSDGTGNSGKDFLGLAAIVTDSGTLGGIDSSTETWWVSKVVGTDGGAPVVGADLTANSGVKALNNVFNSIRLARSRVDLELTTQANFEAYEQLASVNIRYTNTKMADMGFESIAHKTASVVMDLYCPAPTGSGGGYWYFLNSQHLEFVRHPDAWMTMLDFQRPVDQDAKSAPNISMGNLITDCRRAHGVIKNVKVA